MGIMACNGSMHMLTTFGQLPNQPKKSDTYIPPSKLICRGTKTQSYKSFRQKKNKSPARKKQHNHKLITD